MPARFRYERCPNCGTVLDFQEGHELAVEHLLECAKNNAAAPEGVHPDQLLLEIEETKKLERRLSE